MRVFLKTLGFFALRGLLAGIILGVAISLFVFLSDPGDNLLEAIGAGLLFGVIYGALVGLVISALTGLIVGMVAGFASQAPAALVATAVIGSGVLVFGLASLLFAGPFTDLSFLIPALLLMLAEGLIGYLFGAKLEEVEVEG